MQIEAKDWNNHIDGYDVSPKLSSFLWRKYVFVGEILVTESAPLGREMPF
jgi:hypothetical protein